MVVATTATKRITAEAMPAMVLGLETKTRALTLPAPPNTEVGSNSWPAEGHRRLGLGAIVGPCPGPVLILGDLHLPECYAAWLPGRGACRDL